MKAMVVAAATTAGISIMFHRTTFFWRPNLKIGSSCSASNRLLKQAALRCFYSLFRPLLHLALVNLDERESYKGAKREENET